MPSPSTTREREALALSTDHRSTTFAIATETRCPSCAVVLVPTDDRCPDLALEHRCADGGGASA